MFDNIASLKFVKGPNMEMMATAMVSSEGEMMDFRQPVTADGRVEDWMTNVLNEMRRTNRLITKEAVFVYCEGRVSRYYSENMVKRHVPVCYQVFINFNVL